MQHLYEKFTRWILCPVYKNRNLAFSIFSTCPTCGRPSFLWGVVSFRRHLICHRSGWRKEIHLSFRRYNWQRHHFCAARCKPDLLCDLGQHTVLRLRHSLKAAQSWQICPTAATSRRWRPVRSRTIHNVGFIQHMESHERQLTRGGLRSGPSRSKSSKYPL